MTSNPNTPPRHKSVSQALQSEQQSTPGSQGLGAQSGAATNFDAKSVRRMLAKDLEHLVSCSFERYLHYMLSLVGAATVPEKSAPDEAQVNTDLKNLTAQMVQAMKANKPRTKAIIAALKNYCKESTQQRRYPHFIHAFNQALQLTQPLTLGNANPSPEPGSPNFLMFVNHHNTEKKSEHKEKAYGRKPDTEAVFRDAALRAYKEDVPLPDKSISKRLFDRLLKSAQKTVDIAVPWSESMSSQEHTIGPRQPTLPPAFNEEYIQAYLDKGSKAKDADPPKPSGSQSRKRVAGDPPTESQQSTKKVKTETGQSQPSGSGGAARELAGQIAEYAAEAMYNCFGRNHIINMTIEGDMLYVWYFDHESPIRTTGLKFVQDLPYLLLFLFALQRFEPAHFGFIPELRPANYNNPVDVTVGWNNQGFEGDEPTTDAAPGPPPAKVTFSRDGTLDKRVFCLKGRATWVIGGQVHRASDSATSAVMKLSYQEKSRSREADFLREAKRELVLHNLEDACQYLPVFGVAKEYSYFSTDEIRQTLNIVIKEKAARIPCLVVMPRYLPITSRTTNWNDFLDDFFKLMYCHAALWRVGIEHGDISESNLMWDPKAQIPKLCDFDLAHFSDHPRPTGFSNTGTWIFMAEELLTVKAMNGKVKRLYRHDVESFLAVLVYIMCRYQDGKEIMDPPFEQWYQQDYPTTVVERQATYEDIMDIEKPPTVPEGLWRPAARTAQDFSDYRADDRKLSHLVRDGVPFTPPQQVYIDRLRGIRFIELLLTRSPLFKGKLGTFDVEASLKKVLATIPSRQPEAETQATPAPTASPTFSQPQSPN